MLPRFLSRSIAPRLVRRSSTQLLPARPMCSATSSTTQPSVRSYPQEPRVGVGVVVFRRPTQADQPPDVLLIRRAKEPSKGLWCFPGGSLELGETMSACAVREVAEETGIVIQSCEGVDLQKDEEGFSEQLRVPTPFAAVDSVVKDAEGRLKYHYAIVEVAALVSPSHARMEPRASDDAADAMWLPVTKLRSLPDLVPMCARITEEALRRFPIASERLRRSDGSAVWVESETANS